MAKVRQAPASSATSRERAAPTTARTPSTSTGVPAPEKIAARAYEIWEKSGRPEGTDQENWYRAERELRQGSEKR